MYEDALRAVAESLPNLQLSYRTLSGSMSLAKREEALRVRGVGFAALGAAL